MSDVQVKVGDRLECIADWPRDDVRRGDVCDVIGGSADGGWKLLVARTGNVSEGWGCDPANWKRLPPPQVADAVPVGSRWAGIAGVPMTVVGPMTDGEYPVKYDNGETFSHGPYMFRPPYGLTRLDTPAPSAEGPEVGKWYKKRDNATVAQYRRFIEHIRCYELEADGYVHRVTDTAFPVVWEGPVPGPEEARAVDKCGATLDGVRFCRRPAGQCDGEHSCGETVWADAPQKPASPVHDFTDPYAVIVCNVEGQKHVSRVCVRCGTEDGKHAAPTCVPRDWRQESEKLTSALTNDGCKCPVCKPVPATPTPSDPYSPPTNARGSLAGIYRVKVKR